MTTRAAPRLPFAKRKAVPTARAPTSADGSPIAETVFRGRLKNSPRKALPGARATLVSSHVFSNHKGGCGKTTILFHAACEAAHSQSERILVVDTTLRGDLSELLLGGDKEAAGKQAVRAVGHLRSTTKLFMQAAAHHAAREGAGEASNSLVAKLFKGAAATKNEHAVLWRGLRHLQLSDAFLAEGGSEKAPMSTSRSLDVAVRYSASTNSVLLKLETAKYAAAHRSEDPREGACRSDILAKAHAALTVSGRRRPL